MSCCSCDLLATFAHQSLDLAGFAMLTLVAFLEPFGGRLAPRTTPLPDGVVGLPVVAWFLMGGVFDVFGGFFFGGIEEVLLSDPFTP